jgi:eukaryotic-like serine/threonine-protein kinase
MSAETNTAADDRIGGFRYVRTIHPGATSVVIEVVQESTGRRFALKQLLASRNATGSDRRAFAFEARLGMQLRHPNLIRVHEYIRDPEQPYFIMDLFPAFHLKLPVARPSVYPMPKAQLHRILEQGASALQYMHEQGWVHRDVKPENILTNKSGEVRVIDYALALKPFSIFKKMMGGKPPRQGTASYMAPEQIRCLPPTPSADIYSYGITCYEIACGRPPFRANSKNELLQKHISERPIPPSMHNPAITPEFSDLVLKMIQKKPEDRFPNLEEFRLAFSRVRIYKDDPDPSRSREYR